VDDDDDDDDQNDDDNSNIKCNTYERERRKDE